MRKERKNATLGYHCGENTKALVLANMFTVVKVRQAALRMRLTKRIAGNGDAFMDAQEKLENRTPPSSFITKYSSG